MATYVKEDRWVPEPAFKWGNIATGRLNWDISAAKAFVS